MFAEVAALSCLGLLTAVTTFALQQQRHGGLDTLMRAGLIINLLGVTGVWLRCNKPVEGTVLLVLADRHGLTLADLVGIAPLLTAALLTRDEVRERVALR